jgi:hypothetical protein
MGFEGLADRVVRVREEIRRRQAGVGWNHPVTVVAVTKGHGPEAVVAAWQVGLGIVGENRVQEALAKQDAVPECPVEWHLIGSLQRNKARHAVGRFGLIHSVDRTSLARELDRRIPAAARQAVLVQVNCSGESQKGGVAPGELPALLDAIRALPRLVVRGLMTMAALEEDPEAARPAFRRLRELRDAMTARGHDLPELSMGMSGDFPVAVEEGATMVRLGTVLFGERTA